MRRIRDQLATLTIEAFSPDESVRAILTRRNGLSIELDEDAIFDHSDESLGLQIEEALRESLQSYYSTVESIRQQQYGERTNPAEASFGKKELEYIEATEEVIVSATSPLRHVSIEWMGKDDIIVVLKEGTVNNLSVHELTQELNVAVIELTSKYSNEIARIQKRVYKHDTLGA